MKFIRDREKSWPLRQPYGEIAEYGGGYAQPQRHRASGISCDPINPEMSSFLSWKNAGEFPRPGRFDRFAPANGKLTGRVVLGKDFDGVLGTA